MANMNGANMNGMNGNGINGGIMYGAVGPADPTNPLLPTTMTDGVNRYPTYGYAFPLPVATRRWGPATIHSAGAIPVSSAYPPPAEFLHHRDSAQGGWRFHTLAGLGIRLRAFGAMGRQSHIDLSRPQPSRYRRHENQHTK